MAHVDDILSELQMKQLADAGYVVVPKEPTEKMADVIFRYKHDMGDMADETCYNAYRVAIGVPPKPRQK